MLLHTGSLRSQSNYTAAAGGANGGSQMKGLARGPQVSESGRCATSSVILPRSVVHAPCCPQNEQFISAVLVPTCSHGLLLARLMRKELSSQTAGRWKLKGGGWGAGRQKADIPKIINGVRKDMRFLKKKKYKGKKIKITV